MRRIIRVLVSMILTVIFIFISQRPLAFDKKIQSSSPENIWKYSNCLHRRGQNGTWKPANGYFYFGDKGPVETQTKWEWQDDHANDCPIEKLSPKSFCEVMNELDLKRIFFLGDSLTYQMVESLWRLLGKREDPSPKGKRKYFRLSFQCRLGGANKGSRPPSTIEITFKRNDHLSDGYLNGTKPDCTPDFSRDFCRPWIEHYINDSNRTLLVVSLGSHIKDQSIYERKLGQFVETFRSIERPADIVLFRTSVPGHENCQDYKRPLADESEYPTPSLYQWKNFVGYNSYTKEKWSHLDDDRFFMLDIYPMTILRPDAHPKSYEDCLHYRNPGPVDWWNHLLYSTLVDLSSSM